MRPQPAKLFNKYLTIYLIALREVMYFPKKLQATILVVPIRILVLLLVYNYAFSYLGHSINGISAKIAIWSIAVYQILLFAQFRNIFRSISREIKTGNIEIRLNKPYHYLVYKIWETLGQGLPNLILSSAVVVPMLIILTGGVPGNFDVTTVMGVMFLTIFGTLVSAGLYILITLPAFWIDDATPFYWIADKAILVFGGAFVPLALLPTSFQQVANMSPFGAVMFATQMFNPGFGLVWPKLLLIQLIWAVIFLILINFFYRRATKKMVVNGG